MPLHLALLLSLTLHATLIAAPAWLAPQQYPAPAPSIEARLLPPALPTAMAESVSTEAASPEAASPEAAISRPLVAPPRSLQGRSLRRAQSALADHLFYPPEAVARGLEGEVVLLLTLAEGGRLVSATIARSSGHLLLDHAALDAARRIGALPGNPPQTLFPVRFRLQ